MTAIKDIALKPGFDDLVMDSQRSFRALLGAMARPGNPVTLDCAPDAPEPMLPAAGAACLTLLDLDTPLWLGAQARESEALRRYLAFHCGCPLVEQPAEAAFALVVDPLTMPPLSAFGQGTAEYPDRSTTVIIQVRALHVEGQALLRGPGIANSQRFDATPLSLDFWDQVRANHETFPLGVDLLFATADRVAALPRSTSLEIV